MLTKNRLLHALPLVSLIALGATSEVSAQTASTTTEGFANLPVGGTILVVDQSGLKTTGRLLLFTPNQLKMELNGQEVMVERKNVAVVFERSNSMKKGMIIGALAGPVLGLAAAVTGEADDGSLAYGVVVFSAIGAAVGTVVDAMIPEKHLVYADADAFEAGDSNKNGMFIGLITGAAAGFTAGLFKDDCHNVTGAPPPFDHFDCYADEKIVHGLKVAAPTGLAGAALGIVIDKMTVGRRLIHGSRSHRAPVAISISPSLSPARVGLSTRVSW